MDERNIIRDDFLSDIVGKDCFNLSDLDKSLKLKQDSFYTYEFNYNARKASVCNELDFNYITSRVVLRYQQQKASGLVGGKMQTGEAYLIGQDWEDSDLKDIHRISLEIAKISRFYKDPSLRKFAGTIYVQWINNSLNNDYADDFFFVRYRNKLIGYVTLKESNQGEDCMIIDLIGIDKSNQKKGVGTLLMKTVLQKYRKHTISVGTMAENIAALNFYLKVGFKINDYKLVYHKHT